MAAGFWISVIALGRSCVGVFVLKLSVPDTPRGDEDHSRNSASLAQRGSSSAQAYSDDGRVPSRPIIR